MLEIASAHELRPLLEGRDDSVEIAIFHIDVSSLGIGAVVLALI